MKKYLLLVFVASVSICLVSCGSKDRVSSPNEIDDQVMGLLEEMDGLTRSEFEHYFLSINDLHEMAKDETLVSNEHQRKTLLKTSKEDLKKRYKFMYDRLKKSGKNSGVQWSDISFVKFSKEVETKRGSKVCNGELIFKVGNRKFQVVTTSVYNGEDYLLVDVRNLEPVR